jgi:hypothetical protein
MTLKPSLKFDSKLRYQEWGASGSTNVLDQPTSIEEQRHPQVQPGTESGIGDAIQREKSYETGNTIAQAAAEATGTTVHYLADSLFR